MSTFTGESRHIPNTSVKDRIFDYILVHSDHHRCMSTSTDMLSWRSKREAEVNREAIIIKKASNIIEHPFFRYNLKLHVQKNKSRESTMAFKFSGVSPAVKTPLQSDEPLSSP
ncbi:hypothetical protein AVEN_110362-1 [Araneus ventricosus]|uniref:Uncharacterized protein n=1 Tax=Araneus ventricosus TaxID=182803 RepID=A0A4Y2EKR7_ARAVE|nr:hypothetical protein AVEN_110362-1 [Araneus ventricosus]